MFLFQTDTLLEVWKSKIIFKLLNMVADFAHEDHWLS